MSLTPIRCRSYQDTLGSREGLLDEIPSKSENGNGHVARNVRLALMVVDLVEPYVEWASPLPEPPSSEHVSVHSNTEAACFPVLRMDAQGWFCHTVSHEGYEPAGKGTVIRGGKWFA